MLDNILKLFPEPKNITGKVSNIIKRQKLGRSCSFLLFRESTVIALLENLEESPWLCVNVLLIEWISLSLDELLLNLRYGFDHTFDESSSTLLVKHVETCCAVSHGIPNVLTNFCFHVILLPLFTAFSPRLWEMSFFQVRRLWRSCVSL